MAFTLNSRKQKPFLWLTITLARIKPTRRGLKPPAQYVEVRFDWLNASHSDSRPSPKGFHALRRGFPIPRRFSRIKRRGTKAACSVRGSPFGLAPQPADEVHALRRGFPIPCRFHADIISLITRSTQTTEKRWKYSCWEF